MPQRRYSLFDLFLFVAFCSLVLAYVVPVARQMAGNAKSANIVQDLACSADGATVAALFGDGKIRVWSMSNQSLIATFDTRAIGVGGRLALSGDGIMAAATAGVNPSGNYVDGIEIWDAIKAQKLGGLPHSSVWQLAFSPREPTLAVISANARLELFDCSGKEPSIKSVLSENARGTGGLSFARNGQVLISGSGRTIDIWDVDGGVKQKSLSMPRVSIAFAASEDGTKLASTYLFATPGPGNTASRLELWEIAAATPLPALAGSQALLGDAYRGSQAITFLPGDRTLVFANGKLSAWDIDTGQMRTLPIDADDSARMVAAPRRGTYFAVADFQKVAIWDATSLAPVDALWTPPAGGPSLTLIAAAIVLFGILGVRRGKKLLRQCATCGQSYNLANAKDSQAECPNCRLAALPAEVRAQQQAQDRRKGWFSLALLGFSLLLISLLCGVRLALWIAGAGTLAILAIAAGLFAWAHLRGRRLAREKHIVELIESFAGTPAEVLRFGPAMVWCGEGTTLGREIEPELAVCGDRVRALAGRSVSAGPWLRCFVFGNREHFEQALKAFGFVLGKGSHFDSCYFGGPPRVALLEDNEQSRKLPEPLGSLRGLLAYHLIESLGVSSRTPWLNSGLSRVVAHTGNAQRLARLNRRVLADLAAERTLDAKAFFAHMPRIVFRLKFPAERDFAAVAKAAAQDAQIHSFMEFLCGAGSTSERRLAFQKFLADPRRCKRQEEALVASFGCSPEKLLDDWRGWVEQLGVGEHAAPPAEYAEVLASGPVATIKNEQSPLVERLRAIRRLGREGFVVGADALIDVLRRGPAELAAEATWALEAISGQPLGADVARWEAWRAGLPCEVIGAGAESC